MKKKLFLVLLSMGISEFCVATERRMIQLQTTEFDLKKKEFLVQVELDKGYALGKLKFDGHWDAHFGKQGRVLLKGGYFYYRSSALFSDGTYGITGGTTHNWAPAGFPSQYREFYSHFNEKGERDTSLGIQGHLLDPYDCYQVYHRTMNIIAPLDRVLIGSECVNASLDKFLMLSMRDASGNFHTSFGENGIVKLPFSPAVGSDTNSLIRLYSRSNGSIEALTQFKLLRFLPNGKLDKAFAKGGEFVFSTDIMELSFWPSGILLQANQKLLMYGVEAEGGIGKNGSLMKLTDKGELDSSFGVMGKLQLPKPWGSVQSMAEEKNGKSLVILFERQQAEAFSNYLVRMNLADGSLDPSFGEQGLWHSDCLKGKWPSHVSVEKKGEEYLLVGHFEDWIGDERRERLSFQFVDFNGKTNKSFGHNGCLVLKAEDFDPS